MKRVYDAELMKYIALLENTGRVSIKDLFQYNNMLCCVVNKEDVSALVGLRGRKIRKIQNMFNKKLKIVGYTNDVKDFVKDFIYPLEVENIELSKESDKNNLIIHCRDTKTKGLLIGRGKKGLSNLQSVVSRYFKIESIKVK